MMNQEKVNELVAQVLAKVFNQPVNPLDVEADLKATYDADSMDLVDIVESIERKFAIKVPDSVIPELRTFQDVAMMVGRKLAEKDAAKIV